MDATPTVLELVGIPVPEGLDGRSLLPIIEGKGIDNWRNEIVFLRYEDIYYGEGIEHRLRFEPDFNLKDEFGETTDLTNDHRIPDSWAIYVEPAPETA